MSRRFGRNQRRRAREALAQTQTALAMANGLAEWQGDKLRALQSEIDTAREILGPHTVALSPSSITAHMERSRTVQVDVSPPMSYLDASDLLGATDMAASFKSVPLEVMLVDADVDRLRERVHAHVKFADGYVAYGIDRSSLRDMPRRELVRRLAQELAPALESALRKVGVR